MRRLLKSLKPLYEIIHGTLKSFYQDDGFDLAASLAFYAILSTIPMALIAISILGHLLGQQNEIFEQFSAWVYATLPQVQPEFLALLRQLVDKKISMGYLGIFFLFFIASLLFSNIEHILDKVFATSKTRNFWHSRLFSILLLIMTALLLFVPNQLGLLIGSLPENSGLSFLIGFFRGDVVYFLAHLIVFFLLLEFAPNQAMPRKKILIGSVIFGLLIILVRHLFYWYMSMAIERYHFIYGSLSVLVVLILWIYYLSLLFIFCAELVSVLHSRSLRRGSL